MGGYGSGRWRGYAKAVAVEDCRVLDASMVGMGCGILTWTNMNGEILSQIGCELDLWIPDDPSLRLRYTLSRTGEAVDYRITLPTTRPHFGGLRRWFACPLCHRRMGKLYLPPGGTYFGCRTCHHLTYRSCQQAHQAPSDVRLASLQKAAEKTLEAWTRT